MIGIGQILEVNKYVVHGTHTHSSWHRGEKYIVGIKSPLANEQLMMKSPVQPLMLFVFKGINWFLSYEAPTSNKILILAIWQGSDYITWRILGGLEWVGWDGVGVRVQPSVILIAGEDFSILSVYLQFQDIISKICITHLYHNLNLYKSVGFP